VQRVCDSMRLQALPSHRASSRSRGGKRDRVHTSYLRGLVFCDRCGKAGHLSQLIFTQVRAGRGGQYQYFVCSGRTNFN
jgi:hypothetical protein